METLNSVIKSSVLSEIILDYPTKMYKDRKILGIQRDGFENWFYAQTVKNHIHSKTAKNVLEVYFSDIFVV